MRGFVVIIAIAALAACGRFAPDRNLKRHVSENDIVGTWRLLPKSLDVVKKDAGYSPAEGTPHDIIFRADGSCHFRSIDEGGPVRAEYFDTEGTWKLVHHPAFGGESKENEVQIVIGVSGINFNLAEEKRRLHLWQFWGDPDEWQFLEYEKV
jgi:hypothetical protein